MPFLQAQGAGDLNVVAIGFNDATSTITSVTDSAGNVYQLAAPMTRGSGMSQAIYYAKNINAAAAGSNSSPFSSRVQFRIADVRVAEYGGLDTVNPLDTSASAAGSGATANSGNLTTSAANELIFGAGMTTGEFVAGTNGLISRIITPPDGDIAGDKFAGTAGHHAATANLAVRRHGSCKPWHSASHDWEVTQQSPNRTTPHGAGGSAQRSARGTVWSPGMAGQESAYHPRRLSTDGRGQARATSTRSPSASTIPRQRSPW